MSNAAPQLNQPFFIGDELTDQTRATDKIEIIVDDVPIVANAGEGKSILDIVLNSGKSPSFSCMAGVCMACIAVIESGTVQQDNTGSLSSQDIRERKILTCQAIPVSKRVKIKLIG